MTYALIYNPSAGRGKAARSEAKIRKILQEKIESFRFFRTEYPGHAEKLANEIKKKVDVIIVGGGDGTVHEVVNGMMGGSAVLGVIPIGSGNDFVKMFSLPKVPEKAIDIIFKNQRKKIDVGKINDSYFSNGVGIGFDAWVVRESKNVKRLRGFLIYLYAVLKTVFKYQNESIQLSFEGKSESRDIFLMAFGNGKAMGGGFFLTPEAEIDDGKLDICLITPLKKGEVFRHLPKVLNGRHISMKQVQMLRCKDMAITSKRGIAVHADGELLGMNLKKINISIMPKAIEVIYNADISENE
jgi:YegS/Rv2252/BmrU family lipid kinase